MTDFEYFRRLFSYNPETGVLTRAAHRSSRAKAGETAGSLGKNGYLYVSVDGRKYLAHRLAWLLFYGTWPEKGLDHIDGDTANNRIVNLRPADQSQNARNRGPQVNNTSGFKGVTWSKARQMWVAQITVAGKVRNLGRHKSIVDAHLAYWAATEELHGLFARTM